MKDFRHWGLKKKEYSDLNYRSIWYNLQTIRLGSGPSKPLPPEKSEFYDISLGTKCNVGCEFCYAKASKSGTLYSDVCKKAKMFFGDMNEEDKPYQIAVGSGGEPTLHPEFCDFLETIYNLGIVPNYTTNGLTLYLKTSESEKILRYTEKYCGGVAVSANTFTEPIWRRAVDKLEKIDIYLNLHLIISDISSVDRFIKLYEEFKERVHTFVLLPLMKLGRSCESMDSKAFDYLVQEWPRVSDKSKVAFGAHFYDYLKEQSMIKTYLYSPESFSKNLILSDDCIKITPSSFDINTILWKKKYK